MTSIVESAIGAGGQVGRYFSVVGMIPAVTAVSWVSFLVAAGAWRGPFDLGRAVQAVPELGIGGVSALIALSLIVGVVVNPFQFAATQVLEGYWGGTRLSTQAAAWRINAYRDYLRAWRVRSTQAQRLLTKELGLPDDADWAEIDRHLGLPKGNRLIRLSLIAQHWDTLAGRFPPQHARVLPTRLGNSLRASEDRAGQQYGLDALAVAPRLGLLAETSRSAYVKDTRLTMDLSIRLSLVAALCVPITAVLLADDGAWVLLTFAPYIFAYLAYRGAISASGGYGAAVTFQIDLDRFSLYDALRMPQPATASDERAQNVVVMNRLNYGNEEQLKYHHPTAPE